MTFENFCIGTSYGDIRDTLIDAVSSSGGTWIVCGESGVGKTHLLRALTAHAKPHLERRIVTSPSIRDVMDDFRARDIYMGDAIYSRELDLWSQASRRGLE